jgi:hypothetical protein
MISFLLSIAIPPYFMDGFAPWKNRSVLALNAQYSQTGRSGI